MSFIPGTILKRKDPFKEPKEGQLDLTPYNEVKIVGQSLTSTSGPRQSEWEGGLNDSWAISPLTFGEVLDRPIGELQRDYEIVSVPEPPSREPAPAKKFHNAAPSPEDVFRSADKASGKPKSAERVATPLSAFTQAKQEPTPVAAD